MIEGERYVEEWHGLFPRFVLAGMVLAFVGLLLPLLVDALTPAPTPFPPSGTVLRFEVQDIVSVVYFPFVAFALFYLSARIRVNLGSDFVPLAASILLGALAVLLLFGIPGAVQGNPGAGAVDAILESTASALYESVSYTFVGFAAILLSYRRRL